MEAAVLDEAAQHSYGTPAYWNERYLDDVADGRKFDWLCKYATLRELLHTTMSPSADVLELGCGNSRLGTELCADGHIGSVVLTDLDVSLISSLREEQGERWPNLKYVFADVRNLPCDDFSTSSSDVVIDKGTFDAISCNDEYQADLEDMITSIYRVLKPGGVYLLVSYGEPEARLPWLDGEPGIDWTVSVRYMDKRSEHETIGDYAGDAGVGASILLPLSAPVIVSNNDYWAEELGLDPTNLDKYTFIYMCWKDL